MWSLGFRWSGFTQGLYAGDRKPFWEELRCPSKQAGALSPKLYPEFLSPPSLHPNSNPKGLGLIKPNHTLNPKPSTAGLRQPHRRCIQNGGSSKKATKASALNHDLLLSRFEVLVVYGISGSRALQVSS